MLFCLVHNRISSTSFISIFQNVKKNTCTFSCRQNLEKKKLVYFLKINKIYFIPRPLGLLPRNWTFLLSSYWFFRFVLTKRRAADKKRMFQSYDCLRAICTDRIYVRQHRKDHVKTSTANFYFRMALFQK